MTIESTIAFLNGALTLLGPFGLTAILVLAFGYVVRFSPIPNRLIPWTSLMAGLVLGLTVLPFIASPTVVPESFQRPVLVLAIYGACIGIATWIGHRIFGNWIEGIIRKRFPAIDEAFTRTE